MTLLTTGKLKRLSLTAVIQLPVLNLQSYNSLCTQLPVLDLQSLSEKAPTCKVVAAVRHLLLPCGVQEAAWGGLGPGVCVCLGVFVC